MTDNMREVWDAHDKARNKAWREEPGTFDTLDAFKAGAAWQAAKSVPDAELERLRAVVTSVADGLLHVLPDGRSCSCVSCDLVREARAAITAEGS